MQSDQEQDDELGQPGGRPAKYHRQVPKEESEAFAQENGLIYVEASAKEGTNVDEIFHLIAQKLPKSENHKFGMRPHGPSGASSSLSLGRVGGHSGSKLLSSSNCC